MYIYIYKLRSYIFIKGFLELTIEMTGYIRQLKIDKRKESLKGLTRLYPFTVLLLTRCRSTRGRSFQTYQN